MNLSPYLNLHKAENIKPTLRILQKDFYSVYLTHRLCHKLQKVCTLRSLIDKGCGKVWEVLEKIAKVNSRGVGKNKNFDSQGEGSLLNCFFFSFSNH